MGAKMTFNDMFEGQVLELPTGDGKVVRISTGRGNHPNGVWAYRIEHDGKSVVYATDTEHYAIVDPRLTKLATGADVLIHDAQYTPEEYAGTTGRGGPKTGWGHSTFTEAARLAAKAGVKKLILFHHDPMQNDAAVHDKEARAKEVFAESVAAYEGMSFDV
jgi:ribonuclease BN (tRNA processing enzyme)